MQKRSSTNLQELNNSQEIDESNEEYKDVDLEFSPCPKFSLNVPKALSKGKSNYMNYTAKRRSECKGSQSMCFGQGILGDKENSDANKGIWKDTQHKFMTKKKRDILKQ